MKKFDWLIMLCDQYKDLFNLAQVSCGLLKNKDLDAFEDVLAKRNRLNSSIEALHKQLLPVFGDWDNYLAVINPEKADQAQECVERIKELAEKILEFDKDAAKMLTKMKDAQQKELGKLNSGKKLFKAYRTVDPVLSAPDQLSKMG